MINTRLIYYPNMKAIFLCLIDFIHKSSFTSIEDQDKPFLKYQNSPHCIHNESSGLIINTTNFDDAYYSNDSAISIINKQYGIYNQITTHIKYELQNNDHNLANSNFSNYYNNVNQIQDNKKLSFIPKYNEFFLPDYVEMSLSQGNNTTGFTIIPPDVLENCEENKNIQININKQNSATEQVN